MILEPEEMEERLQPILYPESDPGDSWMSSPPHKRLERQHGLDCSYWSPYEFSSGSIYSRLLRDEDDPIFNPVECITVPTTLCLSALRLLGRAMVDYSDQSDDDVRRGRGPLRYFPSILMTYWAGFEAFLRLECELLLAMVEGLPDPVQLTLLEREEYVDKSGTVKRRSRRRPTLDRYWLLLKYGHGLEFNRGGAVWQAAESANTARNVLVHYEVTEAPVLSCRDLWRHLEAITLLWVGPSAEIDRSVYHAQFDLYYMIADLEPLLLNFEERPLHKDWPRGGVLIPCSLLGVDDTKYPRAGTMDPTKFSIAARRKPKRDD